MFRAVRQGVIVAAAAALLAACATSSHRVSALPPAGVYKVGQPYQINGSWYYPHEQPDYDETGIASWYGPAFHGKRTADGEIFDANGLTAAHRTLPLPVNVRVTNLQNGRSLVLRVNDRGPFAKGRIIDVSERAAQLLGFYRQGTARVRVTYLDRADRPNGRPQPDETPPKIASALPPAPAKKVDVGDLTAVPGAAVAPPVTVARLPSPVASPDPARADTDKEPTGEVTRMAVPADTHLYVQAGAFSSYDNARRLRARLAQAGGMRISSIDKNGMRLYRVRMGPFDDVAEADSALARVTALGGNDAQIVVDH
jgi:rare lipoprotein A